MEVGKGGPAARTRASRARACQQGSKPSAVAPGAGVVLVEDYLWKQTRRGNPLLVVRERGSQAREYTYSSQYVHPNAPVVKYYVCLACRKQKEKQRLRSTEVPRMKVLGSGEVYDMRNALHLCVPLTLSQVAGKHYERDQRLSLLNCSALHPKEAYDLVQANFKKELDSRPAEEREHVEKLLPSYKSMRSFYYRKIRPGGVRALRFANVMQSDQDPSQAVSKLKLSGTRSLAAESILQMAAAVPSVPVSAAASDEGSWSSPLVTEQAVAGEAVDTARGAGGKVGGKSKPFFGVPVHELFWKQTQNGNPLLVVKVGDTSAREYIFSSKYAKPGVPLVRYYVCLGCRREREGKALPSRPLPRMKLLEDGRVFDMKTAPHLCSPLTMAQVAGKHFERDHRLSLPNCGSRRARDAYETMRANLSERLSEHPEEERQDIERSLPSFKTVRSMYYRKIRLSGRRWAPYDELQHPALDAKLEPAAEIPWEVSNATAMDEQCITDKRNMEDPGLDAPEQCDFHNTYPLAPGCLLQVETQDPLQYELDAPALSSTYPLSLGCMLQAAVQAPLQCGSNEPELDSTRPPAPECKQQAEAQGPLQCGSDQQDLRNGCPLAPERVLRAAAQGTHQRRSDKEAGAAGDGGSQEKHKPPNGVLVLEFSWKQTCRGNPLLVVKGKDCSAREYIYNSKYGKPGSPVVKYYVCLGCRRERDTLSSGPLPRMKVLEDGKVFDMRNTSHLCTPLSRAQVAGKHFERDHRLSLPNCGARRAREAYEAMRANLADFLSEHPAEEREDIERCLPSFKRVKSMYYRRMRGSGRRWAPYSEPTRPSSRNEQGLAEEEHGSKALGVSRMAEPSVKEGTTTGEHLSSASSPECMLQVAASTAEGTTKAEPREGSGVAVLCEREERQRPPNGVPVRDFFWMQTLRGNPLLVVKGEGGSAREYTYSSKYGKPGAPVVKYYVCLGCRREREKGALPTSTPLPRMKVLEDGKVFDMRNAAHLCFPLTMAQVTGKHFEREHRLSLPSSGAHQPKEA